MTVAEKLTNLAELYRQGLDSRFLDQQLDKLLKREAMECQRQIAQLAERLAVFEWQYHESSEDFLRRWQAGQTQDSFDFTEWASLTQARQFLKESYLALARRNWRHYGAIMALIAALCT